jgi:hypothetical protein
MKQEFDTKRTELAGYFADSGAALLAYMGSPAALAAIQDSEPPRYVVAGTPEEIVKLLPAAGAIAELVAAPTSHAQVLAEVPTQAALDVLAERRRQVEVEGWTAAADDEHAQGQMASAAACYALHTEPVGNVGDYLRFWPWAAQWWKPRDKRRNLVKAGALILADIERIDRAASASNEQGGAGA